MTLVIGADQTLRSVEYNAYATVNIINEGLIETAGDLYIGGFLDNRGVVRSQDAGPLKEGPQISGALTNSGTIEVGANSTLTALSGVTNTGVVWTLAGGTLIVSTGTVNSGTVEASGGTLTLGGLVTNEGVVRASGGGHAGRVHWNGQFGNCGGERGNA